MEGGRMTIEREAAKPKRQRDLEFEDAPQQESIRGLSPRTIRRNPTSDQKKVRREMQRKTASEDAPETDLSRLLKTAAVEDNPFEVTAADGNLMDTKCEDCGKPLGPEVFLSKHKVCGACTRKRQKQVTGKTAELNDSDDKGQQGFSNDSACASCGGEGFNEGGYCTRCGRHKTASKVAAEGISLGDMEHGDERHFNLSDQPDRKLKVTYHEWQPNGDNGQPANGYRKGVYTLDHPDGHSKDYPTPPFRPGRDPGKAFVAEQLVGDIRNHLFKMKRNALGSLQTEAGRPLPTYPGSGVSTPAPKPSAPGDKECASCGHVGAPTLSDTGPACRNCNSYSLKNVEQAKTAAKDDWITHRDIDGSPYMHTHKPSGMRLIDIKKHPVTGYDDSVGKWNVFHPDSTFPINAGSGSAKEWKGWVEGEHAKRSAKEGSLQAEATVFDTTADRLNPGDHIRTPTGQTVKIKRMRNHETSGKHVYMDTDQGTSVVERGTKVQIVPHNSQQQELPGYGTPGGNTNKLPMDPGNVGPSKANPSGSNEAKSNDCPVCGSKGTMHRKGQQYVCSKCGYKENVGAAGPGAGFDFTDMPQRLMGRASLSGAIARRAQEVSDQLKENQ